MKWIKLTTTLLNNVDFDKGIIKNDKKTITEYYQYYCSVSVYDRFTNKETMKKLIDCDPDTDIIIYGPYQHVILEIKVVNENELK